MSRLSIFQAYDWCNTSAAQRTLSDEERNFYEYCVDNHDEICNEDTDDNDPIVLDATRLYAEM